MLKLFFTSVFIFMLAFTSNAQSAFTLLKTGTDFIKEESFVQGQNTLTLLIAQYPNYYRLQEAYFYLAVIAYKTGRYTEAENGFNAVLSSSPITAQRLGVYYWLGIILYQNKNYPGAEDLFLRALSLEYGENSANYINQSIYGLALAVQAQGRNEEALRHYRHIAGSVRLVAGYDYGMLALSMNKYNDAYLALSAYIVADSKQAPQKEEALLMRAEAAFQLKKYAEAESSLRTLLKLSRNSKLRFPALYRIVELELELNNLDLAQRYLDIFQIELTRRSPWKEKLGYLLLLNALEQRDFQGAALILKKRQRQARGKVDKAVAKFNYALIEAIGDPRNGVALLAGLEKSEVLLIQELALFHKGRIMSSYPLLRAEGRAALEEYRQKYQDGHYIDEAYKILGSLYRGDPDRFWDNGGLRLFTDWLARPETSLAEQIIANMYIGQMAELINKSREALFYYNRAWKLDPENFIARSASVRIAYIYAGRYEYNRAIDFFKLALNKKLNEDRVSYTATMAIALILNATSNYEEASLYFESLIAMAQSVEELQMAKLQKAIASFYIQNYAEALRLFTEVSNNSKLENSNLQRMALFWNASTLYRVKNFDAAKRSFLLLAQRFPEYNLGDAMYHAALAATADRNYEEATAYLKTAIRSLGFQEELQHEAYFLIIKLLLIVGNKEAALFYTKEFFALDPQNVLVTEAFHQAGEQLFNQGDLQEAMSVLSLFEKEYPRYEGLQNTLYLHGITALQLEDYYLACIKLIKYIRLFPNGPYAESASSTIAKTLEQLADKNAQRIYNYVRASTIPSNLRFLIEVRWLALQPNSKRKRRELEKIYQRALLPNTQSEALLALADIFMSEADYEAQRRILNAVLEKNENDYWNARAVEALAFSYYNNEEMELARATFLRLRNYSRFKDFVTKGYYMAMRISMWLNDLPSAELYRNTLNSTYPNSKWTKQMLNELNENLAVSNEGARAEYELPNN